MQTLGLRHAAIQVKNAQASKNFYVDVLKMHPEWEPDPQNVYLTSGGHDNLAIHELPADQQGKDFAEPQRLDHLGFALPLIESVDEWYAWIQSCGAKILREIKTHRDGARSFYFADPDGIVIQMIYHPPIARRALK